MPHTAPPPAPGSNASRPTWAPTWVAFTALAGTLALFEFTDLDLRLQDLFYDAPSGRWRVDAAEPVGRALFYDGPKALVWMAGVSALALALGPAAWRQRWRLDRRGLWLAVAVLATVPALAGIGKSLTNCFCPSEIRRYGGDVAYVKLCSPFPSQERPARKGHCFPAGHASGGFALMGWLAARPHRRWRNGALAAGIALGTWMGTYQMLKGAHYLSHTLTTFFVAWIATGLWHRIILAKPPATLRATR